METMFMQNFGGKTKSIMVFLKVAYFWPQSVQLVAVPFLYFPNVCFSIRIPYRDCIF